MFKNVKIIAVMLFILGLYGTTFAQMNDDKESSATAEKKIIADEGGNDMVNGLAALKAGEADEAVAYLKKAAEKNPADKIALVTLADAYILAKKYDEAQTAAQKAVEADPKFSRAHRKLGKVYSLKGDSEKAFQSFNEACNLEPDNAWNFNNAGFMLIKLAKYSEAVQKLEKAVELDPSVALFKMNLDIAKSLSAK